MTGRSGRKAQATAKRRQTTRQGQGRNDQIGMTSEALVKKSLAMGITPVIVSFLGTPAPNPGATILEKDYAFGQSLVNTLIFTAATAQDDTSCTLAVLLANKMLVKDGYEPKQLYDAGSKFWGFYWGERGSPHATVANLGVVSDVWPGEDLPREPLTPEESERIFRLQDEALRDCGADVVWEVKHICVDDFMPSWFERMRAGKADAYDRKRHQSLLTGLCALHDQIDGNK